METFFLVFSLITFSLAVLASFFGFEYKVRLNVVLATLSGLVFLALFTKAFDDTLLVNTCIVFLANCWFYSNCIVDRSTKETISTFCSICISLLVSAVYFFSVVLS